MKYRIGIDVGGTFTDFLLTMEDATTQIYKVLSTPDDPSIATIEGIQEMARDRGISTKEFLRDVTVIVHGTTVATNAVLTYTGAKTGLLTTEGVRDALEMRRGIRAMKCWEVFGVGYDIFFYSTDMCSFSANRIKLHPHHITDVVEQFHGNIKAIPGKHI